MSETQAQLTDQTKAPPGAIKQAGAVNQAGAINQAGAVNLPGAVTLPFPDLYLTALADSLPDALLVTDGQLRLLVWNAAAETLYGWRASEVIGKTLDEVVHTEFAGTTLEESLRQIHACGRWSGEVTQLQRNGDRISIWSSVAAVRGEKQEIVGFIGINRDNTDRKRENERIAASQANLSALIENTDARVWSVDDHYRLIVGNSYFQAQVAAILGRPMRIGETVLDGHFPQSTNEQWKGYYDRALSGKTFNIEIAASFALEKRLSEYRFHPIRSQNGQVIGVTIFERDITARKNIEVALRESEQKNRILVETVHSGIQELDMAGNIVYANAGYHHIYGFINGELIGKSIFDIQTSAADAARLREYWQGIAAGSMLPTPYETQAVRKDGQEISVYIIWDYKRDTFGQINGVIANIVDITERVRMEQQLEDMVQELRRSQGQLQTLSHQLIEAQESERRSIARELHDEIGQELTGINLILEVVQRLPPEKGLERTRQAQVTVQNLMSRVSRLSLDLRPPILDDLGLLPALLWFFDMYHAQSGIQVNFSSSGLQGARFPASIETTVFRVVQESLTNVARHARVEEVLVRIAVANQSLRIVVEDSGQGFDLAAALASGTASGLNGMRERVHLLNGDFLIAAEPKQGTRVFATIPFDPLPIPKEEQRL
jgi:PAS domain S-box-containing protein